MIYKLMHKDVDVEYSCLSMEKTSMNIDRCRY